MRESFRLYFHVKGRKKEKRKEWKGRGAKGKGKSKLMRDE
jgi:hypothetical protein